MVILPCETIIGSETFVDMETRFVQISKTRILILLSSAYASAGAFVWLEVIKRKSTATVFKRIYVGKKRFCDMKGVQGTGMGKLLLWVKLLLI